MNRVEKLLMLIALSVLSFGFNGEIVWSQPKKNLNRAAVEGDLDREGAAARVGRAGRLGHAAADHDLDPRAGHLDATGDDVGRHVGRRSGGAQFPHGGNAGARFRDCRDRSHHRGSDRYFGPRKIIWWEMIHE